MSELQAQKEFCCWHWKQLIEGKDIITKSEAFNNGNHPSMDSKFYQTHPNFVKWIEEENPMKSGWYWYHFCPNCGAQKDSDEVIKAWKDYWNKPLT